MEEGELHAPRAWVIEFRVFSRLFVLGSAAHTLFALHAAGRDEVRAFALCVLEQSRAAARLLGQHVAFRHQLAAIFGIEIADCLKQWKPCNSLLMHFFLLSVMAILSNW